MKKFYLYFIMMFSSAGAFAKTTVENNAMPVYPHYGTQGHYSSLANSRLIAKSHYTFLNGAFVPVDSVKYIYISNDRGGSPSLLDDVDDNVFFDSSYTTVYFDNVTPTPRMQRFQLYKANNQVQSLTLRPWRTSYAAYRDSLRFNYSYDVNSNIYYMLMDIAFGTGWYNQVGYSNTYISGKLTNTFSLVLGLDINYGYDNTTNNLILSYTNTEKDSFVYDNANRQTERLIQKRADANSQWSDSERWSYTYIGNTTDVEFAYRKMYIGNSWENIEKHVYTYDANHNKLTDATQTWANNTYTNAGNLEWIYNSFNQPTQLTSSTWDGSSWTYATNDYQRHFYYAPFVPTNIHDADKNAVSLNMYPVPSSDNLIIEMNWKTPQSFTVSVCDMTGRTLRQYHDDAKSYVMENIAVSDLPSGNYFVRIDGDKGGLANRKFIVVH